MLLFLIDIVIISVLILSFAAFIFLYINPNYSINKLKKNIVNQSCDAPLLNEEEEDTISNKYAEVYNVGPNIYKYEEAENVCKEFSGKLATKKQLDDAFIKGASWCNYGWSAGQTAYYPIQGSLYSQLQHDENLKDACGNIGVNGGYFKDTNLTFGVNCYGIKPPQGKYLDTEYSTVLDMVISPKGKSTEAHKVEPILKFNRDKWSSTKQTPIEDSTDSS